MVDKVVNRVFNKYVSSSEVCHCHKRLGSRLPLVYIQVPFTITAKPGDTLMVKKTLQK